MANGKKVLIAGIEPFLVGGVTDTIEKLGHWVLVTPSANLAYTFMLSGEIDLVIVTSPLSLSTVLTGKVEGKWRVYDTESPEMRRGHCSGHIAAYLALQVEGCSTYVIFGTNILNPPQGDVLSFLESNEQVSWVDLSCPEDIVELVREMLG